MEDDRLLELIDADTVVERLGDGYEVTEGPIWNPDGDYLLFVDVAGDSRHRWDEAEGVRVLAQPSNHANGMTLAGGRLVLCEHHTHSVVRMDADGSGSGREVLASHFEGRELNSPNDLVVRSDGSVYFTDPFEGRAPRFSGHDRPPELDFAGVYRIDPAGGLEVVADDFDLPNGVCLSPDESVLYVCDTRRESVRALELAADGSAIRSTVFASGITEARDGLDWSDAGRPDGLKCDELGNVWVTGPEGVWVYAPSGEKLGVVRIPGRMTNITFGGRDRRWLFATGGGSLGGMLHRVRTKVPGAVPLS
jgi:gluconolactonase